MPRWSRNSLLLPFVWCLMIAVSYDATKVWLYYITVYQYCHKVSQGKLPWLLASFERSKALDKPPEPHHPTAWIGFHMGRTGRTCEARLEKECPTENLNLPTCYRESRVAVRPNSLQENGWPTETLYFDGRHGCWWSEYLRFLLDRLSDILPWSGAWHACRSAAWVNEAHVSSTGEVAIERADGMPNSISTASKKYLYNLWVWCGNALIISSEHCTSPYVAYNHLSWSIMINPLYLSMYSQ